MPYRKGIVGNHETELKPGVKSLLPDLLAQILNPYPELPYTNHTDLNSTDGK